MKRLLKTENEYCGKKYGKAYFISGFLLCGVLGFGASHIIYGIFVMDIIFFIIFGIAGAHVYTTKLVERRKKEFLNEFCDYLDCFAGSLSCGRNSYESFIEADYDMRQLYSVDSPICVESSKFVEGLKSGRSVDEMLRLMAKDTACEDVYIFSDVFSLCNSVGGNLKVVTIDIKNVLLEKIAVEAEIQTELSEPKNELNIMSVMPVVISLMLKLISDSSFGETNFLVSTIAIMIFAFSYVLGKKIIAVKV